jgi:hypothetical protein
LQLYRPRIRDLLKSNEISATCIRAEAIISKFCSGNPNRQGGITAKSADRLKRGITVNKTPRRIRFHMARSLMLTISGQHGEHAMMRSTFSATK